MNQQTDKAILVVSFGTSYEASRKATIEKIEQDIRNAFQDHRSIVHGPVNLSSQF